MPVSDIRTATPTKSLQEMFSKLSQVIDHHDLKSYFEINDKMLNKILHGNDISLESFFKIQNKSNLSYANLLNGNINIDGVIGQIKNSSSINNRYTTAAFSSKRTSDSILNHCPSKIKDDALKFLQISDENFYSNSNIKDPVSTLLNSDLLEYLNKFHQYSPQQLYFLGQASGFYNKHLPFGQSFSNKNFKDSFEQLAEEVMKHFETSFNYRISSYTNEKVVICRTLSDKIKDELKTNIYSNVSLCHYIAGSLSAITYYSSGSFAHTTQERCIFNGDDHCEFHIDLKDLRPFSCN